MKQRTKLGVIVSVVWLVGVATYVSLGKGWAAFGSMELNSFGDFCAGVFAPLAFLWLVIGYAQQGEELAHNVEALRQQANETANLVSQAQVQAEAIKANELHARKDTFFKFADVIRSELLSISYIIGRYGMGSNERSLFKDAYNARNEYEVYNVAYFRVILNFPEFYADVKGRKEQRPIHIAMLRYVQNYEALIRHASDCDPDKSIRDVYSSSRMGELYAGLKDIVDTNKLLGEE